MAAINGLAASVAWTGFSGLFASPGFSKPYRFTLSVDGGEIPTTGFGGSAVVAATNVAAPYSWGGTITARMPNTPASGYSGLLSWSGSNYATNVREWTLDINWAEKDVTAFNGTAVTFRTFIPLLASWRGSFSGYIDSATKLTAPTVPGGTIETVTLKALEVGVTDETFAGTAIVTNMSGDVGIDSGGDFSAQFVGTGDLAVPAAATAFGANSNGIFDDSSGSLLTPTAGALTLTANTDLTYSGDAFPTGFGVRCAVDGGLDLTIAFRGTGALAFAQPA